MPFWRLVVELGWEGVSSRAIKFALAGLDIWFDMNLLLLSTNC